MDGLNARRGLEAVGDVFRHLAPQPWHAGPATRPGAGGYAVRGADGTVVVDGIDEGLAKLVAAAVNAASRAIDARASDRRATSAVALAAFRFAATQRASSADVIAAWIADNADGIEPDVRDTIRTTIRRLEDAGSLDDDELAVWRPCSLALSPRRTPAAAGGSEGVDPRPDLSELVTALGDAAGPDRELDGKLAGAFLWPRSNERDIAHALAEDHLRPFGQRRGEPDAVPRLTASIDAVDALATKSGLRWARDPSGAVAVVDPTTGVRRAARGATTPLAIMCGVAVALRARIVEEGSGA